MDVEAASELTLKGTDVVKLSRGDLLAFGPYRVIGVLARTRQSVILHAEHAETQAQVALKCAESAQRQSLAAILREIAFLRALTHPGIVRILDDGIREGIPWFAMELLHGPSLQTMARDARWQRHGPDAASVAAQPGQTSAQQPLMAVLLRLAETLHALELSGIVHRDIKPENLLMRDSVQPVLIDFGLAIRSAHATGREVLEPGGVVVGSYAFMSPEQLRGDVSDARSDLYSFGATVYWLLTGMLPFSSIHQVLDPSLQPVAPSKRLEGLSRVLDPLVLNLLAKHPQERPQSAGEVVAVLEHLLRAGEKQEEPSRARMSLGRPRTAGRQSELGRVVTRVESLLSTQQDGLLLIVGESGMGKTRLVREVVATLPPRHRGLLCLTGECLQHPGQGQEAASARPLEAFRNIFQGVFEHCLVGGLEESERVIGRRGALLKLYHPLFQALPGQEGHEPATYLMPGEARYHLFTSVRTMLAALAPVLIVLDDLQWADSLSLELLAFLTQTPPTEQRGVVMIGTVRAAEVHASAPPAAVSPSPLERLGLPSDTWQLTLNPLDGDALEQIVGDMLGPTRAAVDVAALLQTVVGGSPFFAAEYVRALVAEELVTTDAGGRWQLAAGASPESLQHRVAPRAVRELILRRLALLPALTRTLLDLASLLERDFSAPLLATATQSPLAEVVTALELAVSLQLLTRASTGELRFYHDLIRRTLEEGLAPFERTTWHQKIAEALEHLHPAPDSDLKAILGSHWEHAQQPSRAMDFYLDVARESVECHALDAAERSYRAYLRLAMRESAERSTVWREVGEKVYVARGALEAASEAFARAELDAQAVGDRTLEALSIAARAELLTWQCRFDEAQALMETATRLLHTMGDRLTEARLHLRFGAVLTQCWRQRDATSHYRAAEALFRGLQDLRGELMALSGVAHGAALLPQAQGTKVLERCRALSRALQDPAAEAEVLWRYSASFSLRDDWRHLDKLEEAFDGLLRAGERRWTIVVLAWLVRGRILCGPAEDLSALKGRLQTLHESTEAPLHRAMLLGALGQIRWHEGDLDAASTLLLQGLGLLEALHDQMMRAHLLHDLAQVRAEQGLIDDARGLFQQSGAVHIPEWPGLFMHLQGLVHEARLERRSGALEQAQQRVNRALELCAHHACQPLRLMCSCEAGHLALARGESGKKELKRLDGLTQRVPFAVGGEVSRALARLKRAMRARAEGFPLWQGEALEDLPIAWLKGLPSA